MFRGHDFALAVVHDEKAAGLQVLRSVPEGVEDRRQHRPVGAQHRALAPDEQVVDDLTTVFAVASSSLRPRSARASSRSSRRTASRSGRTGCCWTSHHARDVVRRQQRHQALGLELAGLSSGRSRSSRRRQDFRERALAWRSTTSARVFFAA